MFGDEQKFNFYVKDEFEKAPVKENRSDNKEKPFTQVSDEDSTKRKQKHNGVLDLTNNLQENNLQETIFKKTIFEKTIKKKEL